MERRAIDWYSLPPGEEERLLKTADLSKMHLASPIVLGFYSAIDADATWQLWSYLTNVCNLGLSPPGIPD